MLESLLKNSNLTKKQNKVVNKLTKKFSENSSHDLADLNSLMFDFYIAENIDAMTTCLDVLTKMKFNGNFELWSEIEPSYCLKYYLSNNDDEKNKITAMFHSDIKSFLDSDEEHQEFLLEIQDGLSINAALEELEEYSSDLEEEYIWRVSVLQAYLHVLTLGANGKLSKEYVLEQIDLHLQRLREVYSLLNY